MNCALGPFCDLDACAEPIEASGINRPHQGHPLATLRVRGTLQGARDVAPQDNREVNQQQSNRSTNIKEKEFHTSPSEPVTLPQL